MKKITLLTVLLAFVMIVNAQFMESDNANSFKKSHIKGKTNKSLLTKSTNTIAIWSDDFSTPANWVISNSAGNSDNWVIGTAGPAGTYAIDTIVSTSGGNFALFDSDALCSGKQIAHITIADSLDCSTNASVAVAFESYYREYYSDAFLQVSIDHGTSWTDFELYPGLANDEYSGGNTNPTLEEINISSVAANQNDVLIRFTFSSDTATYGANGGCGYAWMIDDINVYELDPHDMAITMAKPNFVIIGNDATPSLTVKNLGSLTETSYSVKMTISGTAYDNYINLTTSLLSGNDSTIEFPVWTPTAIGLYDITAIVYNVTGDTLNSNDTLTTICEVRNIQTGDVVNSFPCGRQSVPGIETDGTNIYVTKWNAGNFYRFTMDGTFVDSFTVAGASNVRDMAYDGTYFYGAAANTSLFQMDFTQGSESLVSTITASTACRAIAYDEGATGFWANNWATDLTLFDMSGASQNTISGVPSIYGAAYDKWSDPNNPSVWLFQGTGGGDSLAVVEYDLQTKIATGRKIIVGGMPGVSSYTNGAGGLASFADTTAAYLLLNVQENPNLVIQVYLSELPVVSVKNNTFESNVNVYPNPNTGLLNITNAKNATVNVYNMIGETVATATNISKMDISNLENGTYIVKVISNNHTTTKKITLVK